MMAKALFIFGMAALILCWYLIATNTCGGA